MSAPTTAISQKANSRDEITQTEGGKASWRKFYDPHPSALAFHQFTTVDQRRELIEDLDINGLQERIVTVHIVDESGGKTYVADGITRLEAMEALGWQIVDEHGNWIGAVEGKVDHRRNYTPEKVAKLVISLNAKRRHHQTKQELIDAIDEALKAAKQPATGVWDKDYPKLPSKRGRLGEGRPKDQHKAEVVKQAAAIGISEPTVKAALAKKRKQTDQKKAKKGTLLNGDDSSKVFNTEEFADKLYAKWTKLINRVDPDKRPSAMRLVKEWIEFVERVPLAVEDSGWDLIKGLRPLHSKHARNRREQVSRLITKWIAGKGGAA
jgi:hypothetical protein